MKLFELKTADGQLWLGKDVKTGNYFLGVMGADNAWASGSITLAAKDLDALIAGLQEV